MNEIKEELLLATQEAISDHKRTVRYYLQAVKLWAQMFFLGYVKNGYCTISIDENSRIVRLAKKVTKQHPQYSTKAAIFLLLSAGSRQLEGHRIEEYPTEIQTFEKEVL